MPNAEGRMETLERAQDWWQRLAMSARPVCLDGDDVRVIAAESANALAAARAENERMRADLDAVRKVVQLQADRDWIIVPWLNDAGDYVWRVNVRDVPSKKKGADTYTGTEHVGATPLDAGLRALAAQEGTR